MTERTQIKPTVCGYMIDCLTDPVTVTRQGEAAPFACVADRDEALVVVDADQHAGPPIRCPGCTALSCECLP